MASNGIVAIILAVTVGLLIVGFLLPVGMQAYHNDLPTYSRTLTVSGGITDIGQTVSINLTATNASANATYAVYEAGTLIDTQIVTISTVGTFILPGGTVTITPTVITAAGATSSVMIPQDFGWGSGESDLFGIIGILIMVALLLAFVGLAVSKYQ
jgi:hypothetical protein